MDSARPNFVPIDLRTILFAEDDDSYAMLLKAACKNAMLTHTLHHVRDGAEAMEYLKGEGKYSDRSEFPIPCVVLVDLKMPKVNGFELLHWIRQHSEFSHLPVVVLTSSDEIRDIQQAYSHGANSFLVKPPNLEDLKEMMKMLDRYWLKLNTALRQPEPKWTASPRIGQN